MRKRWRLWSLLVVLLVLGGLLLVPSVRWGVYGWLRGEAFYKGMPSSWWEKEIQAAYQPVAVVEAVAVIVQEPPMADESTASVRGLTSWYRTTPPSLWDWLSSWTNFGATTITVTVVATDASLLDGDPFALPVLLALLRSESAKVRQVAISGLAAQETQQPRLVPVLLNAIHDEDDVVRRQATEALKQIDPEAAAHADSK